MMRFRSLLVLQIALLGLSGCYPDPFTNPGNWSPTGAARQNTAAQVAQPSDLIQGHGDTNSNGVAAVAGVSKALGGPAGTAAGLQTPPPSLDFSGGGS